MIHISHLLSLRRFGLKRALAVFVALCLPLGGALAFTLINVGLYYTAAETDGTNTGVVPDSGVSGTSFTFHVGFADPSIPAPGAAPSRAELHIDLDGNGVVGATVTPFVSPPAPWPAYLLGALLGLWLLAAYLARRIERFRPALTKVAFALALSLIVLGCGGSGGGSDDSGGGGTAFAAHSGLASCTSPTNEIIMMTDSTGGSGNYTTGVDYFSAVSLNCQPGIVLFRFFFQNSVGGDMTFGTAPNFHILTISP